VIGARVTSVSRSSFTMVYRIERAGKATAEGETALICFDYEKRKPRRLSTEFCEQVAAFG
jgi:acyl-CoA thioesterase FadM